MNYLSVVLESLLRCVTSMADRLVALLQDVFAYELAEGCGAEPIGPGG